MYNKAKRPTKKEFDKLIAKTKELKPNIVGISIMCSSYFKVAVKITRLIKKEMKVLVVWGGIHPTIEPEECIKHADIVCIGQGEKSFLELVKRMTKGKNIMNINGLWIKFGNTIIKNKIVEYNFSDFSPACDVKEHFICSTRNNEKFYDTICSRGCPYSCSYCSNVTLRNIIGRKYIRYRNVKDIINELIKVKKRGKVRLITLWDESFLANKRWVKCFLREYKRKINLPFFLPNINPHTIDKKTLDLLIETGLYGIGLGIQSGSEKTRKLFKRYENIEQIKKATNLIYEKVKISFYHVILDNPYEDEKDLQKTLDLLLSIPKPSILLPYSLTYFPRTELTEKALRDKKIKKSQIEGYAQKTLNNWNVRFKNISTEQSFYYALILLVGVLPNKILMRIKKYKILKRYGNAFFRVSRFIHALNDWLFINFLEKLTFKSFLRYHIKMNH